MEQAYVLRFHDNGLLSFSLPERGVEGLNTQNRSAKEEDRALSSLELAGDGLVKWPQRRVISKNRAYEGPARRLYSTTGCPCSTSPCRRLSRT